MTPIRIQRRRVKGWRMPANTIYVGRPGPFRNPYHVGMFRDYTAAHAVQDFKKWIAGDLGARVWAGPPPTKAEMRRDLAGKNLACWCAVGSPCHADLLLKWANS